MRIYIHDNRNATIAYIDTSYSDGIELQKGWVAFTFSNGRNTVERILNYSECRAIIAALECVQK